MGAQVWKRLAIRPRVRTDEGTYRKEAPDRDDSEAADDDTEGHSMGSWHLTAAAEGHSMGGLVDTEGHSMGGWRLTAAAEGHSMGGFIDTEGHSMGGPTAGDVCLLIIAVGLSSFGPIRTSSTRVATRSGLAQV